MMDSDSSKLAKLVQTSHFHGMMQVHISDFAMGSATSGAVSSNFLGVTAALGSFRSSTVLGIFNCDDL